MKHIICTAAICMSMVLSACIIAGNKPIADSAADALVKMQYDINHAQKGLFGTPRHRYSSSVKTVSAIRSEEPISIRLHRALDQDPAPAKEMTIEDYDRILAEGEGDTPAVFALNMEARDKLVIKRALEEEQRKQLQQED